MLTKVSILGYPYQNIENVEIENQCQALIDGYVNEAGHYIKRPGLVEFADTTSASKIMGMYYWRENDIVVVVSNQDIYSVAQNGDVTDITNDQLSGVNRPTFAEVVQGDGTNHLAMADGGGIISWAGSGTTTAIADADAPTSCTSIDFIDGYLLANNGTNSFYASDLNDFDGWTATSAWAAETNPDTIDFIKVQHREILLIGKDSIEVWASTGSSLIFERKLSFAIPDGTIAPYSVITLDGTLWYFNRERRFVRLNGRSPEIVSTPLDKVFAGFSTVTDATADVIQVDGRKFILLQFPTEQKSYIYDVQINGWAEWSYWNTSQAQYAQFKGACALYVPDWGKMLLGDISNGKIYELDPDTYTDDTGTIRFLLRTGHISHGTSLKKRSNRLRMHLKRGVATGSEADPTFMLRWQNENDGFTTPESWSSLGLGQTGEDESFVEIAHNGIYRKRQWELKHTDNTQFIFMGMDEDITVLGR